MVVAPAAVVDRLMLLQRLLDRQMVKQVRQDWVVVAALRDLALVVWVVQVL